MSDLNNKDLFEQINMIKSDAETIDIPDSVKPEIMMRHIEEMEKEDLFEESKLNNKENKKKGKKLAFITGGVAAGLAAAVAAILVITGIFSDSKFVLEEYHNKVASNLSEGESCLATLSSYENFMEYIIVNKSIEANFYSSNEAWSFESGGSLVLNHSDTNTRTEGIAEADVVKTDGEYIYYLTSDKEWDEYEYKEYIEFDILLSIMEADGENSEYLCRTSLNSDIRKFLNKREFDLSLEENFEMMVIDDKLIVFAEADECTYVVFYDIADRANPVITDVLDIQGQYQTARYVDDYLYVFVDEYIGLYNYISSKEYEYNMENAEEVLAPKYCGNSLDASDVYVSGTEEYDEYHMIATVDMNDTSSFKQVKAVLGESGAGVIYVSNNYIYYISEMYRDFSSLSEKDSIDEDEIAVVHMDKSEIVRFSYDKGVVEAKDSTIIEGSIGDEFAIDEYNGYLRLAVSTYCYEGVYKSEMLEYYDGDDWVRDEVWILEGINRGNEDGSALYVLDDNLEIVGSIPQLKISERVYGVIFDGDVAYVVTYKDIDPLYSIDLSDPTNPIVLGALKVPGVSTYLYKWNENTLIGLGRGDNGILKISTFDIEDATEVYERDMLSIEGENLFSFRGAYKNRHKALFLSPVKNLLGFSLTQYGEEFIDTSYKIFSYIDSKLTEVISVEIDGYNYFYARALYVDDYIYIVDTGLGVYVYDINTYEQVGFVSMKKYKTY